MRRLLVAVVLFALLPAPGLVARPQTDSLPSHLSDQEFWALINEVSEEGGLWAKGDIINITSNELSFHGVIPDLTARVPPGGVYLGVGPEQNFSYIAAVQPRLAFVVDIRRGNLDLQLLYKAMFELANDRADFVAMLFAMPRPPGLSAESTPAQIFDAFSASKASRALYARHLEAIKTHLLNTHGFALLERDVDGVEAVYDRLFITSDYPAAWREYRTLMTGKDAEGVGRSFLSTEARFTTVKTLQSRNLVVPVVGDFAGPKALRAVGQFLKSKGAVATTFYLSNVEEYLKPGPYLRLSLWPDFCRNAASLPLDATSTFIRATSQRERGFVMSLGSMLEETGTCSSGLLPPITSRSTPLARSRM